MPEDKILSLPVSIRELGLILKLRKIKFGMVEVHKEHGTISRIIVQQSEKISEEDTLSEVIKDPIIAKILRSTNIILKVGE